MNQTELNKYAYTHTARKLREQDVPKMGMLEVTKVKRKWF